jgi:hypothetical protein
MTTITTQRNRVFTEAPEADDVLVQVILFGEGDTPGTVAGRSLRYLPISAYQECLDWAVAIADQMARPLYVVPLNHNDILRSPQRWAPFADMLATLNDQERGQLRQMAIATCADVMRDCDEWHVRAEAYDILTQLKVIHHD